MPRHAPALECSAEIKAKLLSTSKSRTEEARAVERARIILARMEGKEIRQVARELRTSIATVTKWRRQFCERGLEGLRDRPRPGKPPQYGLAFRDQVLALLEQSPKGLSHWDGPSVAEQLGASVHAVWRALRREGIYLQRLRTWCVSTDPEFAPKAAGTAGYVETDSGSVVRAMKSTYKRNGTLN